MELVAFEKSLVNGHKAYGTPEDILWIVESYYNSLYSSEAEWKPES